MNETPDSTLADSAQHIADLQRQLAERTSFPAEIAEMALAHRVGSAVEQAYRRSDQFAKRRQLAQAWARYITQPPADGAVVPLHAGSTAS